VGLTESDAGGGGPVLASGRTQRAQWLCYVPDDVELWPNLTGGQAIDLSARLRDRFDRARRDEMCDRFDLDPAKKGRTYSKGNRQKVALIFALDGRGLPEGFRYHDLRHHFASLLIASGADVKVVQHRLRHSSAKTTLDNYSHLWPDSDESTRTAVEQVLSAHRADRVRTDLRAGREPAGQRRFLA
jgi:integrase